MRKIYSLLAASTFLITGTVVAQAPGTAGKFQPKDMRFNTRMFSTAEGTQEIDKPAAQNENQKSGISVWSDDFSTPANWTLDNNGQGDNTHGWNINTTSEAWYAPFNSGVMNSTSGGNFAEVQNGDYFSDDQNLGVVYTMTTAASIDINTLTGGTNVVSLEFEQWGALFNDAQTVLVSTDNNVWTEVFSNEGRDTYVGNNTSAVYGNPEKVTVNLTNYIAGNPSTVWIRFQWTSANPNAIDPATDLGWWTTWGWYIDDVNIVQNPPHEVALKAGGHVSTNLVSYSMIPVDQMDAVYFYGYAQNNGSYAEDSTRILTSVTGAESGVVSSDSSFISAIGGKDTLYSDIMPFSPTTIGTYNYSIALDYDSIAKDDDVSNNGPFTGSFEITDYIYAQDYGSTLGSTSNSGDAYEIGALFEINVKDTMYAIDFMVDGNTDAGTQVYGIVYQYDNGFIPLAQSLIDYELSASDVANPQIISLPLDSPLELDPNVSPVYYVLIGTYGGNGTNDLVVATAGSDTWKNSIMIDKSVSPEAYYYVGNVPVVRMNLDKAGYNDLLVAMDVEENAADFTLRQNIPNPFSGSTDIIFDLENSQETTITITDMTGKVIEVMNLGNQPAGNHRLTVDASGYASGVYYYTLSAGKSKMTKKMMIK